MPKSCERRSRICTLVRKPPWRKWFAFVEKSRILKRALEAAKTKLVEVTTRSMAETRKKAIQSDFSLAP